jgi:hypothetical protein
MVKRRSETWPEIALKLSRSILRFEQDYHSYNLPESTYDRARRALKKWKGEPHGIFSGEVQKVAMVIDYAIQEACQPLVDAVLEYVRDRNDPEKVVMDLGHRIYLLTVMESEAKKLKGENHATTQKFD